MTMSEPQKSGNAMIRTNRPRNNGYLRRGESDSVVSSVGCNALHQGAMAGLGPKGEVRRVEIIAA